MKKLFSLFKSGLCSFFISRFLALLFIALLALLKKATRANRSYRSFKKSEKSKRKFHSFFARKTKERIPNPDKKPVHKLPAGQAPSFDLHNLKLLTTWLSILTQKGWRMLSWWPGTQGGEESGTPLSQHSPIRMKQLRIFFFFTRSQNCLKLQYLEEWPAFRIATFLGCEYQGWVGVQTPDQGHHTHDHWKCMTLVHTLW